VFALEQGATNHSSSGITLPFL